MNPTPWRRIERRYPSHVVLFSHHTVHGVALTGFGVMEGGDEFCPAKNVLHTFGSAESWLAHVLLKRCAGCRTEVKH